MLVLKNRFSNLLSYLVTNEDAESETPNMPPAKEETTSFGSNKDENNEEAHGECQELTATTASASVLPSNDAKWHGPVHINHVTPSNDFVGRPEYSGSDPLEA